MRCVPKTRNNQAKDQLLSWQSNFHDNQQNQKESPSPIRPSQKIHPLKLWNVDDHTKLKQMRTKIKHIKTKTMKSCEASKSTIPKQLKKGLHPESAQFLNSMLRFCLTQSMTEEQEAQQTKTKEHEKKMEKNNKKDISKKNNEEKRRTAKNKKEQ